MPTKRLSMRQLRTILRLRLQAKLSLRQIKTSLRLSLGVVQKICSKAESMKLDWPAIEFLDDQELANQFYPAADTRKSSAFQLPDWSEVYRELRTKGITKLLLWEEYSQQYPNRSYSYAQYCILYKKWFKKQKRSMRQQHKAGEKLFVDYAGKTMPVVQKKTGEVKFAQIFVAVMGASNHTYAEATWSQKLSDWINSHIRTFEFMGGVPIILVPDNLRSGVTQACRYDPDINPSYQQMAAHYGTAIIPARPRKPQDKAKAEVGVQIIERWILARLRHHTFFSLTELNQHIQFLLEEVNNKPFKQLKGTRQQWFDSIDKPALSPLPKQRFEYTDIKFVKVNIDYHIQYDDHFYSVPHQLVGEKLELQAKEYLIALYFHNRCICQHVRSYQGGMTTTPEHMPVSHEKHHKWTPGRLMNWAKDIGDEVLVWVQAQLQQKQHEEQAYRVCLGLLNLSRNYPKERLNNACRIANQKSLYRLKQVKSILQSNQDKLLSIELEPVTELPQSHENIRGPKSYH